MRYLAVALVIAWISVSVAFAADRPNIVLIMADDMGYSDIGCYGSEIETPNIDALAGDGVKLAQFYNTGRCCPTRASLLTGLYPHQTGVGHMTWRDMKLPGYRADLSHNTPTIAELLKGAGYATYMSGKWHLTINDKPDKPKDNWPRQRGFDRYYGTIKGSGSFYDPAMLVRDNQPITPRSDPDYKPENYYYTDAIADQAIRFMSEHGGQSGDATSKPFFMYVAFTSPHWPLHAPEEDIAEYKGKYDQGYAPVRAARFERMKQLGLLSGDAELSPAPEEWADVENKEWEARCMEVYAAQIDRMDQNIGRIVSTLTELGQLENTLIVFLADNGGCDEDTGRQPMPKRTNAKPTAPRPPDEPMLVSNPPYTLDGIPVKTGPVVMPGGADSFIAYGRNWANVSNTPFRLYKHYVHEGGISTPFIAHWPAKLKRADGYLPAPAHLIDLVPTFLEIAEAKMPETFNGRPPLPLEGVSLMPLLTGASIERDKPIFFEHEGNRAVRDGNWKLVAKGTKGAWELYDIARDRSELHDLATGHPDRVQSMAKAWQAWAERCNVLPLVPQDAS